MHPRLGLDGFLDTLVMLVVGLPHRGLPLVSPLQTAIPDSVTSRHGISVSSLRW